MRLRQPHQMIVSVVVLFLFTRQTLADEPVVSSVNANVKIRKVLEETTEMKCLRTPLQDLMLFWEQKHDISIALDFRALDDIGVDVETPVTRSLKGVSLKSALQLVLSELNLTYVVKDEVLWITTAEIAQNNLELRIYPVRDLASLPDENEDGPDYKALSSLIQSVVAPNTWDEVGGPASLIPIADMLVISQEPDLHGQIKDLLAGLRELPPPGNPKCGQLTAPVRTLNRDPISQKIIKALGKTTTCRFSGTPLSEVVALLSKQHGIAIQFNRRSLEDVGIATDTPVTAELENISLQSVLRHILRQIDLTYLVQNQVLLITTPEVCESYAETVIFPVFDLLDVPATAKPLEIWWAMDRLIDVITSMIEPNSWDEVGGPGSIAPLTSRAVLVVSQVDSVQEKIAELLTQMRKVRAKQGPSIKPEKSDGYTSRVFLFAGKKTLIDDKEKIEKLQIIPPAELEAVIFKMVAPDSWKEKPAYLKALPGRLVVHQKRSVVQKLENLLLDLGLIQHVTHGHF